MAFSVVSFSFSMAAQPEPGSPLCWVFAFLTTPRLTPTPTFAPQLKCPPSIQFVGLILPSNSHAVIWTRLHASAISSDVSRSGSVISAIFKWPVWSSSSGNNCHAVHRSLSPGASVYESIMVFFFTSSHFISQFPPTRFPLITAIECVTSFRCITLNGIFGRVKRSKHNTMLRF